MKCADCGEELTPSETREVIHGVRFNPCKVCGSYSAVPSEPEPETDAPR